MDSYVLAVEESVIDTVSRCLSALATGAPHGRCPRVCPKAVELLESVYGTRIPRLALVRARFLERRDWSGWYQRGGKGRDVDKPFDLLPFLIAENEQTHLQVILDDLDPAGILRPLMGF